MDDAPHYELDRPDLLLRELLRVSGLDEPSACLLKVERMRDAQQLVAWTTLWSDPPIDEHLDRRRLADDALTRLGMPDVDTPYRQRPLVVPVVVRPGLRVWTFDEIEVMLALRYALNAHAFRHWSPVVVTQSGWWVPFDELAGDEPRARWSAQAVATMTRGAPGSTC